MLDAKNNNYQLGLVKWFGGYSHKKGKEIDFGYIQSMDGKDIFIHRGEIKTGGILFENDLVIFNIAINEKWEYAKNLYNINAKDKVIDFFKLYIKNRDDFPEFFTSNSFKLSLIELLRKNLNEENKNFLQTVRDAANNDFRLYDIIKESNRNAWLYIFKIFIGNKSIKDLLSDGLPISFIPPSFAIDQENILHEYIEGLNKNEKDLFFEKNIKFIPTNIVLVNVINKELTDESLISNHYAKINNIIKSKFRENNDSLPEYVNKAFSQCKQEKDYFSNPTVWRILEPLLLKKRLYNKKNNVSHFFEQSLNLKNNVEYFILANLFPLIQANNSLDVVYEVFIQRLWEGLVAGKIDINDDSLLNIFPSCTVMSRHNLSCEAFYWSKENIYLCRGQKCNNPKVMPDIKKHYLDFNVYDWFQHYGVNYINESEPSERDFPIKIAGYFNRLKEIFRILQCRECNILMKPDMRYARVEYIDYESGEPVKKNMAAAYRTTVFHCGTVDCKEYKHTYYINHCLGFGCESIIDSRDLKIKCDNDFYICRKCGSCCGEHAKVNAIGSCPDCGSKLDLYDDERNPNRDGKNPRYVRCSNQNCAFKITENLPKKFFLKSCSPVKKINRNSGYK